MPVLGDVVAAVRSEWLKLWKRPATWVLGLVLVALMLTLAYGLVLVEVVALGHTHAPSGTSQAAIDRAVAKLQESLYPEHMPESVLGGFSGLSYAGAIAVIFGVMAYGSEFGWATLKTIFTQRPGRLATLAGKLVPLAFALLVVALALLAAGAAASSVFGAVYGHLAPWPSFGDLLRLVGVEWLLLGMWASFGVLLGLLFRQSALAIGLGIVYTVIVEGIVSGVLGRVSSLDNVRRGFPGANATALAQSLSPSTDPHFIPWGQATAVTCAFLVLFLLLTALLLTRRDVT